MSSYILDLFRPLFRRKKPKKAGMPRKGRMVYCDVCHQKHVMDQDTIVGAAAKRRHLQKAAKMVSQV